MNAAGSGIVVVGAGLAGLRAAEQCRSLGFPGRIVVLGGEHHAPYNRPPLSKQLLAGTMADDAATLRRTSARGIDMRLGVAVTRADLGARVLVLADGTKVRFDGLVIATGLRARRLAGLGDAKDRLALRTLDDARRLRDRLDPGVAVLVLGAGFVGCEVASSALSRGCRVTLVDPAPAPMAGAIGRVAGGLVHRNIDAAGIDCRLATIVSGLQCEPGGRITAVLDDGSELRADVVVEAVGAVPNVDWLPAEELDLSDGVLCDDRLRALSPQGPRRDVVVAGDLARFPLFGRLSRVEHWTMAVHTARRAAATLIAGLAGEAVDDDEFEPVPGFWCELAGVRVNAVGMVDPSRADEGDGVRLLEAAESGGVIGYHRRGVLEGAVLVGRNERLPHYQELVSASLRAGRKPGLPSGLAGSDAARTGAGA